MKYKFWIQMVQSALLGMLLAIGGILALHNWEFWAIILLWCFKVEVK